MNFGADSPMSWSKSICNPKRASREPQKRTAPFKGGYLERAGQAGPMFSLT